MYVVAHIGARVQSRKVRFFSGMGFYDPVAWYSQNGVYLCAWVCSRTEQGWEDPLRRILVKFGGVMWDQSLRLQINSASKSRRALANAPSFHFPVSLLRFRPVLSHAKGPPTWQGKTVAMAREASWRLEGGPGL